MSTSNTTLNPTSTVSAFAPATRGGSHNSFVTATLPTTAGAAVSLPAIDSEAYPATFLMVPDGNRTLDTAGFVTAFGASSLMVHGNTTGFAASASTTADHVVLAISGGVITITNAATNPASATTAYTVTRIA